MKSFYKTLFLFLILSTAVVSAQKYSLEIGSVNPKQFGSGSRTNYFYGGRIGVNAEFALKNNFSLLTGVLYSVVYSSQKQYYTSSDSVSYKTFNHSIDIPVRLNYTIAINKNLKVFGFAGPNLNIGLFQPRTTNAVISTTTAALIESQGYTVPTSGTEDLYKDALINRINFQMGAGGGVQWKKYILKGGYDFGINSINKVDSGKMLHQSGWYVSLVYQF